MSSQKELKEELCFNFKEMMSDVNQRLDGFKELIETHFHLLKFAHTQAEPHLTQELRDEFKKTNMRLTRWITGCGLADIRFSGVDHE